MNSVATMQELQRNYAGWIQEVKQAYMKLLDLPMPTDELYAWTEGILELAGWILDLSLTIEQDNAHGHNGRYMDVIQNIITHYHESLDRLRIMEDTVLKLNI